MPADDLALLIEAARAAGDIALGYWRADPDVWDKGSDDPVSEADIAVDAHLRDRLLGARPDYGWLSEETPDSPERLGRDRVFIVDPIDGTRAFVAGQDTWAHSIAIVEAGVATAGVVYLPARDRLYAAAIGQGAHLNDTPIAATGRSALADARILSNKAGFDPAHWSVAPDDLSRHFRPSLAYRMALVAEGRFDAMLTFRDTWEWDIAAGAIIAAESGAIVTDCRGAEIVFNSDRALAPGLVVSGAGLHEALLSRLSPAPPPPG